MKKKRQNNRIKWIVCSLLCVFLCIGCGVNDKNQETLNDRVDTMKSISVHPLIHTNDPTNENMAGMLQDVAKDAIVQIQMNQVSGSGVIWKIDGEKLVVLTAAHVLAENSGQVLILFADGYQMESSEYDIDASADVAFVYIDMENMPKEHLNAYYLVNVDKSKYDEIASEDIVIAIGSVSEPGGEAYEGKLINKWIWVEDFQQYMMLGKLVVEAGMSGGGVFDEEGYFVGILCGVNEQDEVAILPLAIIESIYQGIS